MDAAMIVEVVVVQFHERLDFALEGQIWMISRTRGDDKESDVQTQLKEYITEEVSL